MGRSPCCDKMGLKQGSWTAEEDKILINYISRFGHENWRALPKRAGLLRCGKSCRLRWMNYLRPDIKRGNFTIEEEETIIRLHHELGNRWSLIAARLPGRTDNEIKNVWNTNLKKRVREPRTGPKVGKNSEPNSPVDSSSEFSSVSAAVEAGILEDSIWAEVLPNEEWSGVSDLSNGISETLVGGEGDAFWYDLFHRAGEFAETCLNFG